MSWNTMMMAVAVAAANPDLDAERPDEVELSEDDVAEIEALVFEHLETMLAGDAERVFELCSEGLRRTFPGPEAVLAAVHKAIPGFDELHLAEIGPFTICPDGLARRILLADEDGGSIDALFLLVREAAGAWRTQGLVLVLPEPHARAA